MAGHPRISEPKVVGDSENHVWSLWAIMLRVTFGALLYLEMFGWRHLCQEELCRTVWRGVEAGTPLLSAREGRASPS